MFSYGVDVGGQVAPSMPKQTLAVGVGEVTGVLVGAAEPLGDGSGEPGCPGALAVGATVGLGLAADGGSAVGGTTTGELPPPPPPHPAKRTTTAKTTSQRRICVDGSEMRATLRDA